MNQPEFDFTPVVQKPAGKRTIQERFTEFHELNPHVYRHLVRLTRETLGGHKLKIGIAMLFEVLRWQYTINTRSVDGFKLNNDFRALYARLIMLQEPDLTGVFELRAAEADKHSA
jgi:hypothetical protein